MRHILDNLVSNSLKYRDSAKAESWVQLALRVSPEGYEFSVSDNGVGMPGDDQYQVFELFHRADPAARPAWASAWPSSSCLWNKAGGH